MKLAGSIIHEGKVYEAGEDAPKGADLDRLKRLGLIGEPEPAPRGRRPQQ